MAQAIITLRIMPESPEEDLKAIEESSKEIIIRHAGPGEMRISQEPIAFGLKSVNIIFVMDENKKLEPIETEIADVKGVNSVEAIDVRRAIG